MDPRPVILADGKKFLWDGRLYNGYEDAVQAADSYRKDHFDVQVLMEGEVPRVYTRRVVQSTDAAAD